MPATSASPLRPAPGIGVGSRGGGGRRRRGGAPPGGWGGGGGAGGGPGGGGVPGKAPPLRGAAHARVRRPPEGEAQRASLRGDHARAHAPRRVRAAPVG